MPDLQSYRERAAALFAQKDDRTVVQMFRYLFVAAAALAVDFTTLVLLTELFQVHYILAAIAGFALGIGINYVLSVRWVFKSRAFNSRRLELLAFVIIGAIGLLITALLMWVMTDLLAVYYIVSKLLVTAVVFFWNFLARKFLLFNNRNDEENN